ncbi:MAG: type II toxin-antitoxin system RelE/ParE family toxin [Opitutaceae bacterium]
MSRRLLVRPEAEADITAAALWYEERVPGLGAEFVGEIRTAIERAQQQPLAQVRLRRQPEVRRILARRFPYRIFYIVRDDALVVFAVLHAARHDRQWQQRT